MEGDGFSDPRRRATRRPRGGARGRGRGRGQPSSRGSGKRPTNIKPRPAPNLGSNEYRYREREEQEEDENVYDAGADFEEIASQPMYDPTTSNEDVLSNVSLSEELAVDFSKLESVLSSVPLWVRLGEHSRFALGVPEDDKIENYVDPLPSEGCLREDPKTSSTNDSDTEFLRELAGLSFEEEVGNSQMSPSRTEEKSSNDQQEERHGQDKSVSSAQTKQSPLSSSPTEERDDFDKWLDEI